ncbi:prepilin peptidase [Candidatus Pacearchaeota archaeon]|nr:prepilin peptidase [Candidatus Pacearchaeota archaeon]
MIEIIFLMVLALSFMTFAVFADFRYRIVPNWLNFSLIAFVLAFRFFYSLFNSDFNFLYQGLIGLGIFFLIGNGLYYGRMFAGGDAKLMIALGAILPFSESLPVNLQNFLLFFILFLFSGAFYGITASIFLFAGNHDECIREIKRQFWKNRKLFYLAIVFAAITLIFGFNFGNSILFYPGILILILPFFYIFAKTVDEKCLVRKMKTKNLTEGEWLYNDLKIGKKTIKARWEGINKEELKSIRKKFKEIKIRQGIPFTPAFLISFVLLVWFYFKGISILGLF